MLFLVRLLWNGQINAFAYWYCICVLMVNILSKMSFYVHFQYLLNDSLIIVFYWIKVTTSINSKTQLQKELFVIFTYKSIRGILDITKNLHIPSKSTSLPNPPMFCLYSHTKNKGLRQSILIFWMELLVFRVSWTPSLPYYSPYTSWDDLPPIFFTSSPPNTLLAVKISYSRTRHGPVNARQKNMCHKFVVVLQCRKRCSLLSPSWPHNGHFE